MPAEIKLDAQWFADMEARVHGRKSAEQLVEQLGSLMKPEIEALPDNESRRKFWEIMLSICKAKLGIVDKPAAGIPAREKVTKAAEGPDDRDPEKIEEALAMAEQIREYAEEVPEEGEEFAMSVAEKARDIAISIDRHEKVTDRQMEALSNMLDGVLKWVK